FHILAVLSFVMLFLGWSASLQAQPITGGAQPSSASSDSGQAVYGALADTLEDPDARRRLVDELRALAEGRTPEAQKLADPNARDDAMLTASGIAVLSQCLGNILQELTTQLGNDISDTLDAVSHAGSS